GQAVATGAARFLIVALDILREVHVYYVPDVRLVDAHSEGNRGDDDANVVAEKHLLVLCALVAIHSSVIGKGLKSAFLKIACQLLRRSPRQAVDNTGLIPSRGEKVEQHLKGIFSL